MAANRINLESRAANAPPLEQLHRLQVLRTTLVKFLEWKNFEEVVQGCYVRVLLEMRDDARTGGGGETPDAYYVAPVKGVKRGPSYTGFSWDGISTEWHLIIDLPPCFRSTPNANVVQLNCISNTQFKQAEYDFWLDMCIKHRVPFITVAQIDLRVTLLNEHRALTATPGAGRGKSGAGNSEQEEVLRQQIEESIRNTHVLLPHIDNLPKLKVRELTEVERLTLECLSKVRLAINARMKCAMCKRAMCTVICYPCKHQAACRECAQVITDKCPAPGCNIPVQDTFEAYTGHTIEDQEA